MTPRVDLTGRRFGELTVISLNKEKSVKTSFWNCNCSCGGKTICPSADLNRGHTTSCGCVMKARLIEASTTHGLANTSEYNIWLCMKDRCLNPNNKSYKNYGGRGISFCKRWESFENFYEDMGPRPNSNLTLERDDNEKGYSKNNCRWDTRKAQNSNKRSNRKISHLGKEMILSAWASYFGVTVQTLWCNLRKKSFSDWYDFYERKRITD